PASPFVAAFMGAENVLALTASRLGDALRIDAGASSRPAVLPARQPAGFAGSGPLRLEARFRSEAAALHPANAFPREAPVEGALVLDGQVTQVSYPGGSWRHVVALAGQTIVVDCPHAFAPDEGVSVRIPSDALFLFAGSGT